MVKFREAVLSSGRKVFGGRDSVNNDELVFAASSKDLILHTDLPGSPFVNVGVDASKEEVYEAAVFCAKYSQAWRDLKRDVVVGVFRRCDMKKGRRDKEGTWSVDGRDKVRVKKSDILRFEERLGKGN